MFDFAWMSEPQGWLALLTLTVLEIVLGVDNIIFISILSGKLPPEKRQRARVTGLMLAMVMRIALLFSISLIIRLTEPWVTILGHDLTGKDFVLIGGGLFLLAKATHEIHQKLEGAIGEGTNRPAATFASVIVQILLLDLVFSIDSVVTAVGMADDLTVMVIAVVIAVGFMMVFARAISEFVERHPTIKMLALSFLLLIGFTLVADGLGQHIPKGYVYFAMGFSVFVEMLNLRLVRRAKKVVQLHKPYVQQVVRDDW